MSSARWAVVFALGLLWGACGPSDAVDLAITGGGGGRGGDAREAGLDRGGSGGTGGTGGTIATGGTGGMGGTGGTGGAGGSGGSGGSDGTGGTGGSVADMAPDLPVDLPPDLPPDMPPPDVPPDMPPGRTALVVVANNMMPSAGDMQLRTSLMARGFTTVTFVDDAAPAPSVAGVALVVIAASSDSNAVLAKYRDVTVPVLSCEPAVFDDMGMTGPTRGTHYDEDNGTQVTISMAAHPMAAGLMNDVAVVTMASTLTWGAPAAGAERVASFTGMTTRSTIFGYPKGAAMVMGNAPARRVGFFASDTAAPRLTDNGKKLLEAAIDWALLP